MQASPNLQLFALTSRPRRLNRSVVTHGSPVTDAGQTLNEALSNAKPATPVKKVAGLNFASMVDLGGACSNPELAEPLIKSNATRMRILEQVGDSATVKLREVRIVRPPKVRSTVEQAVISADKLIRRQTSRRRLRL